MAIHPINIRVYNSSGGIDSSLFPSIAIYDNLDNSIDFSGTMSLNTTLQTYQFLPNVDTTKNYTCNVDFGVSALTRYVSFGIDSEPIGGGGVNWNDLIDNNSSVVGSFGNKFAQYGGVSHIIDRSSLDEESKNSIQSITDKLENVVDTLKLSPKVETKYIESTREIVRIEKVQVPSIESKALAKIIIKGLKELSSTLTSIIVKGLIEIKNNK